MIILAILIASGASACLPAERWGTRKEGLLKPNVVSRWNNELTWNGAPIDDFTLRQYMDAVRQMNPEPPTVIDTTAGDCVEISRIAKMVDRDGHCTPALCLAYDVPRRQPPPPPVWRSN